MRGIKISSYVSSPLDLSVQTLPDLAPHPTKYLIKIHASGTNFFDLLQIRGKYQHQPPLPWISGAEFAGEVLAVPTESPPSSSSQSSTPQPGQKLSESQPPILSDASGSISSTTTTHTFKVGDRVFGSSQGAYATHIHAPSASLLPVPNNWSYTDAAGLYVTFPTSYGALVTRAHTQPGEWVLVHAGAGGVGLAAVQIAKALGATVIATAGTQRKREICKRFGADYVVDYGDKAWPQEVIRICKENRQGNGQAGVDVVYDPVGMIDPSIKCIAWNGRLLVIGFAGGNIEKVAMNRVLLKNISIVGLHWGQYLNKEQHTVPEVWRGIFDLINSGKLRPISYTDKVYRGLDQVPLALKALGGRDTWGKVVVETEGDDEEGGQSKSKL